MTAARNYNVASHLPLMAAQQPETAAVHFPQTHDKNNQPVYQTLNYRELDCLSNRIAAGLKTVGIDRGVRTVLMVKPSINFFALTFALFKVGAVPILIDPGMGIKNLKVCLAEAEPEAFIGIPKAQIARLLLGWGKGSLKTILTVGRKLFWGGTTLDRLISPFAEDHPFATVTSARDEMAAILFTSGSTGVPKGAVYSHGNFTAQVDALRDVYNIQPGEIDLPTFPLFALFAPALGMTSVIPEMDFTRPGSVDPEKIVAAIRRFQVTTMFGSPALIRRIGIYGEKHKIQLPTLKRAISAGAPVPAVVLERFVKMLRPGVEVFTPYGATEALPVCSIGSETILRETRFSTDEGKGVCVGFPVPGIELEIITISDEEISRWDNNLCVADGIIGEIVVRGAQVTRSYYNRPESTRLAKIALDEDQQFFHRMGDLGYRDDTGRIWFCGRKAHRVVTPVETFYTIPCEAIFNTHTAVLRTALVGVGQGATAKAVLCVELEDTHKNYDVTQLGSELKALGMKYPMTRNIHDFLVHPEFPVDIRHNAKIFREKLAVWAEEQVK